jgi:hypothetical protein
LALLPGRFLAISLELAHPMQLCILYHSTCNRHLLDRTLRANRTTWLVEKAPKKNPQKWQTRASSS